MTYELAAQRVFWTIQGEGALLGTPMCFVRLAGCSVGCSGCDTNYTPAATVMLDELMGEIRAAIPAGWPQPWVWITGGEPTDQDLPALLAALVADGAKVALATSGVRALSHLETTRVSWISVSPHAPTFAQRHGHEVKLVPGLGGLTWDNLPLRDCGSFPNKYVQPMAHDTARGVAFVQSTPGWHLSPQAHKGWRLP